MNIQDMSLEILSFKSRTLTGDVEPEMEKFKKKNSRSAIPRRVDPRRKIREMKSEKMDLKRRNNIDKISIDLKTAHEREKCIKVCLKY
jgi:hypothetical protein